eukprot:1195671-Prorocentrum_minimum.AAC.1
MPTLPASDWSVVSVLGRFLSAAVREYRRLALGAYDRSVLPLKRVDSLSPTRCWLRTCPGTLRSSLMPSR